MDFNIQNEIKTLKWIYIIHIFILVLILTFDFILLFVIYWLNEILKHLYLSGIIISITYFLVPIMSLIFICLNKLKNSYYHKFKALSLMFCFISIILGIFLAGILMADAIESPEFCKECPFNLPLEGINSIINSNDFINKCPQRRCVVNSINYEILEKNENNYYEYICNYDPSSEFEETVETNYNNSDNIKCDLLNVNNFKIQDLKNTFSFNFYYNCYNYVYFYKCERNKEPNKFKLKENFVCPDSNYMTILIIYSMFNVILNLGINFIQFKLEYNKYLLLINPPIAFNRKTNSFSSTLNSSKIQNENNDNQNKFENLPTEILIVSNDIINPNNNKKDNINEKNKNIDENNDKNINNINIDNESVLKNLNSNSKTELNKNKKNINNDIKSAKDIDRIPKINLGVKTEDKEEDNKEKKLNLEGDDNRISLSFDDFTLSSKRIMLGDEKESKK